MRSPAVSTRGGVSGESDHPRLRLAALLFLLAYAVFFLGYIARSTDQGQWDFKTYYWAAQAFHQGENPYDLVVLSRLAGNEITLPYLYTPITLYAFLPFAQLPFSTAYYLYLAIKVVCLAALFAIWFKVFLPATSRWLFFFFCLIAFNNCLVLDILSGNISVYEQLLLWSGFALLLSGRAFAFVALLVTVSLFKITTFFLILALPFSRARNKGVAFLVGIGSFAVLLLGTYWMAPELSRSLGQNLQRLSRDHDLRGMWNPSTFALLRDLLKSIVDTVGIDFHRYHPTLLWLVASLAIVGITYRVLARSTLSPEIRARMALDLVCCVYILINPRLVTYSYTLLLVPAYTFLSRLKAGRIFPFAVALMLLPSTREVYLYGLQNLTARLWEYHTLVAAYGVWAGILWGIGKGWFEWEGNRGSSQIPD